MDSEADGRRTEQANKAREGETAEESCVAVANAVLQTRGCSEKGIKERHHSADRGASLRR